MYQEDDPYLADVRKVFLDFPEAVEIEAWGRPTFRAGKKIFGVFAGTDEHPWGVIFKPDAEERVALLDDERFYSPPYFGPGGWLALDHEALRRLGGVLELATPTRSTQAHAQSPGRVSGGRRRTAPPAAAEA